MLLLFDEEEEEEEVKVFLGRRSSLFDYNIFDIVENITLLLRLHSVQFGFFFLFI